MSQVTEIVKNKKLLIASAIGSGALILIGTIWLIVNKRKEAKEKPASDTDSGSGKIGGTRGGAKGGSTSGGTTSNLPKAEGIKGVALGSAAMAKICANPKYSKMAACKPQ